MTTMNALEPTHEQLERFIASGDGPVHMLNLLKFRDRAEYQDGRDADVSGRDAYFRYGGPMIELVRKAGGDMVFSAEVDGLLIGDVPEMWDMVAIVTYPSAAVMAEITQSPEFREIAPHRKAGLAGQLLIPCRMPAQAS